MKLKWLFCLYFGGIFIPILAQVTEKTTGFPHALHQQLFSHTEFKSEREYNKAYRIVSLGDRLGSQQCALTSQVYGWHPAWRGSAYENYDFGLLSTVAYFAYDVNPTTGSYRSIHQWRETGLVQLAHQKGTQVELTAANFGAEANRKLLSNPKATQVLVDSLLALIAEKDADGICIDFEGIPKDQRTNFTRFIHLLSTELHRRKSYYQLTLVVYAVDWGNVFDIPALNPLVDRFVVMAYDYHGAAAPNAGPIAPLNSSSEWGKHNVNSSIDYYLQAGAPKEKLLLGVPYYGYKWATKTQNVPSSTSAKGIPILFADLKTTYQKTPLQWDTASSTSFSTGYLQGRAYQMWVSDAKSLRRKYQLIKKKGIAGVGIWA
ncbi:MAG TPA: hypothetical protein ENJ82_17110, partial [Bacteroidetes bacterium]|nr:hypothetical protein [Bacteroidota bacterium]